MLRYKNDNDTVITKNIVGFFKGIGVDGLIIPDFLNFLDETKLTYKLDDATKEVIHEEKANKDHVLYGKNIVMTGFRDVELSILIEKHGARIINGVNKKTFAVIVKEK